MLDHEHRKKILILLICTVGLMTLLFYPLMKDLPKALEAEVTNRKILLALAEAGAASLEANPDQTLDDLREDCMNRLADDEELGKYVKRSGVEDIYGRWLQFRTAGEEGEFEWRSGGRDQQVGTKDDRGSRFRAGEVTVDPTQG